MSYTLFKNVKYIEILWGKVFDWKVDVKVILKRRFGNLDKEQTKKNQIQGKYLLTRSAKCERYSPETKRRYFYYLK